MSDHAYQIQYRDEYIASFEQNETLLRVGVTTEAVIKGNQATFLVAGSGGASAVTRGLSGRIPSRPNSYTQTSATLVEYHDLPQETRFNIFTGQSDHRAVMQKTSVAVLNRQIDSDITTILATGTQDTGNATTASLSLVMRALVILGNNDVPYDGGIYAAITPAFYAYLLQAPEFSNAQYVSGMPFEKGIPLQKPMLIYWNNVYWIVHPDLTGKGTAAEKCFMWHKSAVGHAADKAGMNVSAGYNEEQDYSWARASCFMGSCLLQNSGVVVINHDGSEFVAV